LNIESNVPQMPNVSNVEREKQQGKTECVTAAGSQ
jgi:hypothetical protein